MSDGVHPKRYRERVMILGRMKVGLVAACVMLSLSTPSVRAAERVKALIPARVINEAFSPFTVAKYMGYFEQEGVDVTLVPVGGSNEVALAISSGAGDIGGASPGQSLIGISQGLNIKYFYELNYRSIWTVTVKPDSPVNSIKDLKGKTLGVAALGSAAITFGKALTSEAGLNPDGDVAFIAVGSGAQAVSALNRGAVDALIFSSQETAKFEAIGFKIKYLDVGQGFASLPDVALLTRRENFQTRSNMLIGFARAVAKGYVFSVANPEAAVRINWKLIPESEPTNLPADEALKVGLQVNVSRMKNWDSPKTEGKLGLLIKDDWKRHIDFMRTNGQLQADIPLDSVITNDLIGEINNFDKEAIKKDAQQFDIGKLK
jgi:NitT/TauT family transport system substrate-binding protein